jgi:hypothetical protein
MIAVFMTVLSMIDLDSREDDESVREFGARGITRKQADDQRLRRIRRDCGKNIAGYGGETAADLKRR